jgi:DNA-binding NtrC family response regulator
LLRVLEDGCVQPVGASESRQVDVRIIAATNADLEARMESGAFRQDLFFRLARYRVTTPSVRDRPEDIPLLAASFLKRFATEMGLRPPPLSAGALAALRTHRFPGNVRELRNLIERALIESGGAVIEPHHLGLKPVSLGRPVPAEPSRPAPAAATPAHPVEDEREALPLNLAETEDILIQRALKQSNGNIAEAARLLGVHRTRIYRKLAREEENPGSAEA